MNNIVERLRQARLNQTFVTSAQAKAQVERHQAVRAGRATWKRDPVSEKVLVSVGEIVGRSA